MTAGDTEHGTMKLLMLRSEQPLLLVIDVMPMESKVHFHRGSSMKYTRQPLLKV